MVSIQDEVLSDKIMLKWKVEHKRAGRPDLIHTPSAQTWSTTKALERKLIEVTDREFIMVAGSLWN